MSLKEKISKILSEKAESVQEMLLETGLKTGYKIESFYVKGMNLVGLADSKKLQEVLLKQRFGKCWQAVMSLDVSYINDNYWESIEKEYLKK